MVRKSYGKMRGTRQKLQVSEPRAVTSYLQKFGLGQKVCVSFVSHRIPHPRFQGQVGTVVGVQGKSYVVSVRSGAALKRLCVRPEHLRAA